MEALRARIRWPHIVSAFLLLCALLWWPNEYASAVVKTDVCDQVRVIGDSVGEANLGSPGDIDVDDGGRFYVASRVLNGNLGYSEVLKLRSNGSLMLRITKTPDDQDHFSDAVTAVATDDTGAIYVASRYLHKFSATGTYLWTLSPPEDRVMDVVVDQSGSIYVSARSDLDVGVPEGKIYKYSSNRQLLNRIGDDASEPGFWGNVRLAVDTNSNLIVLDGGLEGGLEATYRFTPNGKLSSRADIFASAPPEPWSLDVDSQGNAYVTTRFEIVAHVFAPDGQQMATMTHQPSAVTYAGVAVDRSDHVFLTDSQYIREFHCTGLYLGTFSDDDGSVFENSIEWLAAEGITKGCNPPTNSRFCPDDLVTRGEMAAFLVRALGYSDTGGGDLFTDDDGHIFENAVDKLATAGVTRGCNPPTNTRFCPDRHVTRGEMAAFLVRAMGYNDPGTGDLFTDDDGHTFESAIDRLGTAGVTKGCNPPTNDKFCPDDHVTRGQMAAFLRRALGE